MKFSQASQSTRGSNGSSQTQVGSGSLNGCLRALNRLSQAMRTTLLEFASLAVPEWTDASHSTYLADRIQQMLTGRTRRSRLLIALPPGHGKSTLASKCAPAWYLGRYPWRDVLAVSHENRFATGLGQEARRYLEERGGKLFGVEVDQKSRARGWWQTEYGGRMWSVGRRGAITGKRAHLIVLDDVIKGKEEASSRHTRDSIWDWYRADLSTRLEPGGSILFITTRWHLDDLAGRLLEREGDRWDVVSLPALAEAADPMGRFEGEALWPERWPRKRLEARRQEIGPYYWSAEYQQRPVPLTGGLFERDWLRWWRQREDDVELLGADMEVTAKFPTSYCWRMCTVDLACSTSTDADYFVCATWMVTPASDLLLTALDRRRIPGPDQAPAIERAWREHMPQVIVVESTAYQQSLVQELVRRGLPAKPYRPARDKVARAQGAAIRLREGKIFIRQGAPWADDYLEELFLFPAAPHDDQVDVTSMAADNATRGSQAFID